MTILFYILGSYGLLCVLWLFGSIAWINHRTTKYNEHFGSAGIGLMLLPMLLPLWPFAWYQSMKYKVKQHRLRKAKAKQVK